MLNIALFPFKNMRIQVRKCPFTGKIFEEHDMKKYVKHLNNIREKKKDERKVISLRNEADNWLLEEKSKITHLDQISEWALDNQIKIMELCNAVIPARYPGDKPLFDTSTDRFNYIELTGTYSKLVSNSHSCPKNGVRNWCNEHKNLPTGYPGYSGRIEGRLDRSIKDRNRYPYSDFLHFIGINTLSGGGGNEVWRYGVTIFLSDWPAMQRELEEQIILSKLKG